MSLAQCVLQNPTHPLNLCLTGTWVGTVGSDTITGLHGWGREELAPVWTSPGKIAGVFRRWRVQCLEESGLVVCPLSGQSEWQCPEACGLPGSSFQAFCRNWVNGTWHVSVLTHCAVTADGELFYAASSHHIFLPFCQRVQFPATGFASGGGCSDILWPKDTRVSRAQLLSGLVLVNYWDLWDAFFSYHRRPLLCALLFSQLVLRFCCSCCC